MQQHGQVEMPRFETREVNPAGEKTQKIYESAAVERPEHSEGLLTRLLEHQTAKLPSDTFLVAAIGALGLSLYYYSRGKRERSNLIGLLAPTLLTMGVYNKVVKMLGPR